MSRASRGSAWEGPNRPFARTLSSLMSEQPVTTQAQLAEITGKSRQTISQYVNGTSEPPYDTLVVIADYFNVSIDYLLCRTETRTTDLTTQKVCEITGLNEHSIDLLNGINACTMGGKYIETPDLKEHSIDPSDSISACDMDDEYIEMLGLNEHSIDPSDGISACDTSYECSEIQRFGRNPDYAFCLVNEFIDFAFSPVNAFSIPYDHYLLFREQVEQNQISVQKWEQLSPDEKDKLIAETLDGYNSAINVRLSPFFPKEAAILFRNSFCDGFKNYLESKYPTQEDPLNNNRLGGAQWQQSKNTPAKMG